MLHHIFSDMAGAEDTIRCINCMEEEGYISNPLKLPCKDMTCSGIHCEKCLSKKIIDGKIACISCRCVLVCACYINVFIKQLGSYPWSMTTIIKKFCEQVQQTTSGLLEFEILLFSIIG